MKDEYKWTELGGERKTATLIAMSYSRGTIHRERIETEKFDSSSAPASPSSLELSADWDSPFFVWRQFIDDCVFWHTIYERWYEQDGINCAAFRNEGTGYLSSELVRQADAVADLCWVDKRHYTYVDPKKVRSTNPGFCFLKAGWRKCGVTKRGLIILERVKLDA